MPRNLGDIYTGIANAIREKKHSTATILPADFVDEILSIGGVSQLDYAHTYNPNLQLEDIQEQFSDIANAIRLKTKIEGNLIPDNFDIEILKIEAKPNLTAPHIYLYSEEDSNLPDSLDQYIRITVDVNNGSLISPLPQNITTEAEVITLQFTPYENYDFNLNSRIEVTGAEVLTWAPASGSLVLTSLLPEITVTISADKFKLDTPVVALWSDITFEHENGTVLKTQAVMHGEFPAYLKKIPTKDGDNIYPYYVFTGWGPDLVPVDSPVVYVAKFTGTFQTHGNISWQNFDGTDVEILEDDFNVPIGTMPEYNGPRPTRGYDRMYTYILSGWVPKPAPVTGDATYLADYELVRNVQTDLNDGGGLTYKIISQGYQTETNSSGGTTYNIGDVE